MEYHYAFAADEADAEFPTDEDKDECLYDSDECHGPVYWNAFLSGSGGGAFYCDRHWGEAVERYEATMTRYPYHAPSDFDPTYAGERWDDDY